MASSSRASLLLNMLAMSRRSKRGWHRAEEARGGCGHCWCLLGVNECRGFVDCARNNFTVGVYAVVEATGHLYQSQGNECPRNALDMEGTKLEDSGTSCSLYEQKV
jgi:hypothetical protein